ncbi:twin-arginine translocase TatA/TatE family subunit [Alistipes communis]|jgi:twin arginine-targeting protein translocase, tatA/E family|uniref:twin-arginine translocase TatA/TatE family subunit n=1 Tax=Alistipes communis TaxID=2585118 RepID=UPI003AF5FC2F
MTKILFLGNLGVVEIVLIALIVLLLFGGRKIPELMKGIGRGIRSFKEGTRGDGEEPKQKE